MVKTELISTWTGSS